VTAQNIESLDGGSRFTVISRGEKLGEVTLRVPGRHNIQNSLAAIAIGLELSLPFTAISQALNDFAGVGRRLEIKGDKNGIMVIDDYGHHPTEIQATINAVKNSWPKRRLFVLFQPHRFTRTQHLHEQFGPVFAQADEIRLLKIYPAGEQPLPGVTSDLIYTSIKKNGQKVEHFNGIDALAKELKPTDIVLTLGAGDVWKIGEELLQRI
jgi:UDP-N-acetylmuramate--alanine ligase